MLVAMLRFMRGLIPAVGLLCLGITVHAAAPPAAPVLSPVLGIEALGKGTAPIDGPWQFHLGDNMTWAQPETPDVTGVDGWEQLTADQPWGVQGHPSYAGFAWYRKHLHLEPAAGTDGNFALLIPSIDDVYEIYWNGQLVGRFGQFPPHSLHFYLPPQQTFGLGAAREGVLAFRIWKAPLMTFDPAEIGGFETTPFIGSPEAIAASKTEDDYAWMRSQQFRFALWSLFGLVGALGLLLWLRSRDHPELLALAVYCGASAAATAMANLRLPFSFSLTMGLEQPLIGFRDVGLWFLLLYLFRLNLIPRVARWIGITAVVALIAISLDGGLASLDWSSPLVAPWVQTADGVLTGIFTIADLLPLVIVGIGLLGPGLRGRLDASRWFLAIAAALNGALQNVILALLQGSRFTHWHISGRLLKPLFTLNGNRFPPIILTSMLLFAAIIYAVYRTVTEASQRQTDLEREFQSARELQQVLIPETLPMLQGYAVTSAYRPAQEVGGDFFQIIPLEGHFAGSSIVVIGDVSGKGLKAAMTVSLIVGAARTLARTTYKPGEILAGLNAQLYGRLSGGFATCLILRLSASGRCTMASAGHMAPILNDSEIEMEGSLPLGILAEAQYKEIAIDLREGDHLALYTDGLLEARSRNGELFSFERLKEMFSLKTDAAQATEMAVEFGQDDDITVLTVRRLASSEESSTRLHTRVIPAVGAR
jgi:hypothetical protein